MAPTRRDVLWAMAAVGALVAHPGTVSAAQVARWRPGRRPDPVAPRPAFAATRDGFTGHIEQVFQVLRSGLPPYRIGLASVVDAAAAATCGTAGSQHCFTAIFIGPASDPLPEGIYDVATPAGAALLLFLKRGPVVGNLRYYEAPFNGLLPA